MANLKTRQEEVKKQQKKYLRLFNRIYRTENPVQEQLLWMELLDTLVEKVDDQGESILSDEEFVVLLDKMSVSIKEFEDKTGERVKSDIHDKFLRSKGVSYQDVDTNKDFINIANYVRRIKGSLDLTMPAVIKYITDNKTEYKLQKEKIRGKKDKKATFWILTKE